MCQHIDLGLLQDVLPSAMIEEPLETYQMWEDRERKLNMVVLTYWLTALHVYPQLSMRAVYAKLVSGQRAWRDDVPQQIPVKSAFSYRREQLGSELLEELFAQCAGPKATEQTPGAFWRGLRRLSVDGTVESVPDTPGNRVAFRYSTDAAESQSPFPQVRLVLLVECGTHLICDAELSACRQGEASSLRLLLQRWRMEQSLLLWDSGFHSSWAIFAVCARGGQVLGRLKKNVLLTPFVTLADGSYLTHIYQDQDHHRGAYMLVRVISYTFTDARIPGAGEQVYRLVTALLDPFLYPAQELAVLFHERWHAELVIGETRTVLRLSARPQTPVKGHSPLHPCFSILHMKAVRTLLCSGSSSLWHPSGGCRRSHLVT